jgi:hypothetical protein
MESKYTAGQWELRRNKIFVSGTYNSIATVHIQKSWDEQIKPIVDTEAIANAKLIAAAPELLEALQVAPILSMYNNAESFIEAYERWRDNIKSPAIKKATE